jgi:hypothetical protein
MKKFVLFIALNIVLAMSITACVSGHRSQAWHPGVHK